MFLQIVNFCLSCSLILWKYWYNSILTVCRVPWIISCLTVQSVIFVDLFAACFSRLSISDFYIYIYIYKTDILCNNQKHIFPTVHIRVVFTLICFVKGLWFIYVTYIFHTSSNQTDTTLISNMYGSFLSFALFIKYHLFKHSILNITCFSTHMKHHLCMHFISNITCSNTPFEISCIQTLHIKYDLFKHFIQMFGVFKNVTRGFW
jgi:hypothetical protein